MKKRFWAASTAVLVAAVATAVAATTATATARHPARVADQLVGAGATFPFPIISKWVADYPSKTGTSIVYQPIGSGGGIAAITGKTVDFGASDAPLTPDQLAACGDCVQIPWVLGATSVMYNLSGAPNNLHISGPVLAEIYLGKITKWDDPAIQKLNPKVTLPSTSIAVVYRSDGSGTSYNFTDYLSSVSGEFKSKVGVSTQPPFPVGTGAKGSSGVSGIVSNTNGAIGYADIAYAKANHLKFFNVENSDGVFVGPGLRAIAASAAAIKSVPANNEMHIVNPPKGQKLAYPICTFSYVIVHKSSPRAAALRKFIFYALTQGQSFAAPLLYGKVPNVVIFAAEKTLKQVTGS